MDRIKPLSPVTFLPVDEVYRDRQSGVRGNGPPAKFFNNVSDEMLHVIDYFLGDGSEGSGQDGNDLEQLRKAIQAAVAGVGGDGGPLTTEEVQDIVAEFMSSTGASIVYDDAGNALSIDLDFASNAETQAGVIGNKAVTPAGLSSRSAAFNRTGLVQLASSTEVQTGTENSKALTPAGLSTRTATIDRTGLVERSTDAEVIAGTADKIPDAEQIKKYFLPRFIDGNSASEANISFIPIVESSIAYFGSSVTTGAIEFAFNAEASNTNTMLSFEVVLDNYSGVGNSGAVKYLISGYLKNQDQNWREPLNVWCSNPEKQLPVHFRYDTSNDLAYVYIGDLDDQQSFGGVVITNLFVRYTGTEELNLVSAITTSLVTSFKGSSDATIEPEDVTYVPGITDIGSPILATYQVNSSITQGNEISGTSLRYAREIGGDNGSFVNTGVWRAHAASVPDGRGDHLPILWVRVS